MRRVSAVLACLILLVSRPLMAGPGGDGFSGFLADLRRDALARGVKEATFDAALRDVKEPDPAILARTRRQGEFSRPVWDYLVGAVTPGRVARGQARGQALAATLRTVESRYGVPRSVVLAVWGVESDFGASAGTVPTIRALATLAAAGHRGTLFRDELLDALLILQRGDITPDAMSGSWAGAMGQVQFLPSTYLGHAVDFDGDGRRDIWGSVPDALASTANYLVAEGWRRGERWGAEAILPAGFDVSLADETTARTIAEWRRLGLRPVREEGLPETATAVLFLPAGIRGPAFLLLPNFAVILRYNTSFSYALTVGHLSDRLRGLPSFAHEWPRGDRMLGLDERRDMQSLLSAKGYAVGTVDGKIGPRTRSALRAFQAAAGLPPDGYADAPLLETLRSSR